MFSPWIPTGTGGGFFFQESTTCSFVFLAFSWRWLCWYQSTKLSTRLLYSSFIPNNTQCHLRTSVAEKLLRSVPEVRGAESERRGARSVPCGSPVLLNDVVWWYLSIMHYPKSLSSTSWKLKPMDFFFSKTNRTELAAGFPHEPENRELCNFLVTQNIWKMRTWIKCVTSKCIKDEERKWNYCL